MSYVSIKVKEIATAEDLKRWEDHMLEKSKCWNKFCLGIYEEKQLHAVYVTKDGNPDDTYLTTLCEDCIKDISAHDILVNDSHLMIETKKK